MKERSLRRGQGIEETVRLPHRFLLFHHRKVKGRIERGTAVGNGCNFFLPIPFPFLISLIFSDANGLTVKGRIRKSS